MLDLEPRTSAMYGEKDASYFSTPRLELIELINRKNLKILEIGCGVGGTGRMLLETGMAKSMAGVELVPEHAEAARLIFNEVLVGNIEEMTFDWIDGEFDCYVFGDVLEHLSDPWGLLKRLRPYLANDGIIVASIPNIKHWPVLANLIFHDDWKYAESGILDITHLRFFTRTSAIRLFSSQGYSLEIIRPYFNGRRYSLPNKVTLGVLAGFLAERWLMRLKAA